MNLSCPGGPGGLPENACLFFKVIGLTDVLDGQNRN